jgi:diaminohydroxyphosphoribosylaminopyrimidine deaminase/5-amino-6-(5-phosphoribosylamino)uracil reductase
MGAELLTLDEAMTHAVELAHRGPSHGPNPQVGCVILAPEVLSQGRRRVLARGWHRGAGTLHAEADALANAIREGVDVAGATAVVTLEPCNHTGRTGPCSLVLVNAGVADVVVGVSDPNPVASGGAEYLRSHGVRVTTGFHAAEGEELLRVWLASVRSGRPYVTLKTATSIDGCVAAADGTSKWITGTAARRHAHEIRATIDAILVGTGTVLADDPELTAREADGSLAEHQPLRVVLGEREIPDGARLHQREPAPLHIASRDVHHALRVLAHSDIRHLLVEGGPTIASAFLAAGVVDEIHSYVAPLFIGDGRRVTGGLGGTSMSDARRFHTVATATLGDDVLLVARASQPHTTLVRGTGPAPPSASADRSQSG